MDDTEVKPPFMPAAGDEVIVVSTWRHGAGNEFEGRESTIEAVVRKAQGQNWLVKIDGGTYYVRYDVEIVAWVTTIGE